MPHRSTDNSKAIDAFLSAKAEIDSMLERLTAFSAEHFDTNPDDVTWSHVGSLNHYCVKLREISNMAFGEGEHAG